MSFLGQECWGGARISDFTTQNSESKENIEITLKLFSIYLVFRGSRKL